MEVLLAVVQKKGEVKHLDRSSLSRARNSRVTCYYDSIRTKTVRPGRTCLYHSSVVGTICFKVRTTLCVRSRDLMLILAGWAAFALSFHEISAYVTVVTLLVSSTTATLKASTASLGVPRLPWKLPRSPWKLSRVRGAPQPLAPPPRLLPPWPKEPW